MASKCVTWTHTGFSIGRQPLGRLLAKSAKNHMKRAKLGFLGQNSVGRLGKHGGISQSFAWWGVSPWHMHPHLISDGTILPRGSSGFDLCISVAFWFNMILYHIDFISYQYVSFWFNYMKFHVFVILNRYLSNTHKNVWGNIFMFSESLDFIYEKCKRKQLGFPLFVTTKQNKMKKFWHTCRCC